MNKIYLSLLILCLFGSACIKTDKTALEENPYHFVNMNIEGIKFDSLKVILAIPGSYKYYKGETKDSVNWRFQIPDSIFSEYFIFSCRGYQSDMMEEYPYGAGIIFNYDTLRFGGIFVSNEKEIPINLLYKGVDKTLLNSEKELLVDLILKDGTDADVPLSLLFYEKYFEWNEGFSYEEIIDNYKQLISEYPNSYALAKVVKMMIDYPRPEDGEKLYNLFSDKVKQSDVGEYLRNYIEKKSSFMSFKDVQLPNWKTGEMENIMVDTSKPCLVVFSASWCGPCREKIPRLKELYAKLHDKMDMVYLSIDKEDNVDAWRKTMIDNEIPWRSLLAYSTPGIAPYIPYYYLVYPNGEYEVIDDITDGELEKKL
ncbi:thiol-disulfide isomerase/thioredoxin [Dysgonomonadaceae bacterium PH5-43]|nr:thiol-disulfide isomerase/thioredoxin [Dysgonomonadaceae bacterium PH5-43]